MRDRLAAAWIGFRARRSIRNAHGRRPWVHVDFDYDGPPADARISRRGDHFALSHSRHVGRRHAVEFYPYARSALFWFSQTGGEVGEMTVNLSDGNTYSEARFSPSGRPDRHVLIPDPHFFSSRGLLRQRLEAERRLPWQERSDDLIWRGALNGDGRLSFFPDDRDDPTVIQRLRMVMILGGIAGTDVRLAVIPGERGRWSETARRAGFMGGSMPATAWLGAKYAIDIDGFANTWTNLLVRWLFGCCVFKVASQFGYRQWYYDRIAPFEHFIPVRADMADFAEMIAWARDNPLETERIAENGRRFAEALTFDVAKADARRIISGNWDRRD